jgi:flagellar protein FliT
MEAGYSGETPKYLQRKRPGLMGAVALCYKVTEKLLQVCQQSFEESERSSVIKGIEALLSERDSLLQNIKPPFSSEELAMGKQINVWNQIIDKRLKNLFSLVKADIQQTQKKKTNMVKYSNPYEGHQLDGVFYDKRN